ncbi:uncharacterized protein LOC134194316 isoform X3 [Corticium candelabrum]|uniref:uncharacterized protein LOC134194316 isoform X3 n=1 Tax=Corticium candelabrum TaxID=121492 RepID=UPI002E266D4B|nr:uncharacterized protein LOC134194316 isoform X3 [Corticium candelabrum]
MFKIQEHHRKCVRVVQVDVVDNGDLNIQYRKKKQQFETEKKPVDELFVFHGTSDTLIDAIVKDGFKVGGKDIRTVSGSMYGIAVYTAENPSVAMLYAKRGESKKLLLSRILPGREDEDYTRGADEHVFVLETSEQLLPQYVVHIGSN